MSTIAHSAHIPRICELPEARIAAAQVLGVPDDIRNACGLATMELSGAIAVAASCVDVLAFNRVIGLGIEQAATDEDIDACIDFFRSHDVPRFFIQLSPDAGPKELPEMLAAKGLRHYSNWAKLYGAAEPGPYVECDLRIEEIGSEHAEAFGALVAAAFGFPDEARRWAASLVAMPGWRHYMAFDGATPVATGALALHGETGWLSFAATDPVYRRRGAQSALIARRMNDAAELGCRWLTVEAAEDTPEKPNPSYHNLLRMGFVHAYLRPNWIWVA